MDQDIEQLLEIRASLEKKNEQLRQENNKLKMELTQSKDELEISKKIIHRLKEKIVLLGTNSESDPPSPEKGNCRAKRFSLRSNTIKLGTPSTDKHFDFKHVSASMDELHGNALGKTESNSSLSNVIVQDEPDSSIQNQKNNEKPNQITDSKNRFYEFGENFVKNLEKQGVNELQTIAEAVNNDKDVFYQYNEIYHYQIDSPMFRTMLLNMEKKHDTFELILKRWCNQLKEIALSQGVLIKSVDIFANQLLQDKEIFKNNKEIYNLIMLLAQFLKEQLIYKEILQKTIVEAIQAPLKSFYQTNLLNYKETRKKLNKCQEDFELIQARFLGLKKHTALKDPINFQNWLKNYLTAYKNYEFSRVEHIQNLDSTNINVNIEIVDKICGILSSQLAYYNSVGEILIHLENQIDTYITGITKKMIYSEEIISNFKNNRDHFDKIYSIYNANSILPNTQLTTKEGYLFLRNEAKEFKKRYFCINDDGIMYILKSEDPEFTFKEFANLKFSTVKETNEYDVLYCFELMSIVNKKPFVLQADTETNMHEWINTIKNITEKLIFTDNANIKSPETNKNNKNKDNNNNNSSVDAAKNKELVVFSIIEKNKCADCSAEKPSWISLNLCTIICLECSGIHRSLGSNISKVRSLKFDNLNSVIFGIYKQYNWEMWNKIWEANIGHYHLFKPKPESTQLDKEKWIKMKYVERLFLKPISEDITETNIVDAIKINDIPKLIYYLALNKVNLVEPIIYDGKKRNYIHIACMFSNKYVIEYLLLNGSKLDMLDQDSCNPLDVAMLANNIEAVEYLVKRMDDEDY